MFDTTTSQRTNQATPSAAALHRSHENENSPGHNHSAVENPVSTIQKFNSPHAEINGSGFRSSNCPMGGLGMRGMPFIQRKCAECEEEDNKVRLKPLASAGKVAGNESMRRQASESVTRQIESTQGNGSPLPESSRSFMESRFQQDFSGVRIHDGTEAAGMSKSLNAQAFTVGKDIYFNSGKFSPGSEEGKQLLAHELTHTIQQGGGLRKKPLAGLAEEPDENTGLGGVIQRDLAIAPPNEGAAVVTLTATEVTQAIAWNRRRFHDPYNIMNVRDIVGIEKYPAVIDEDFVQAVVRWQADFGLTQDGKFGAATTGTVIDELTAEGLAPKAETLSVDNTVDTVDVVPRTYNPCAPGLPFEFDWEVAFNTTLRNGFIIQRIDNTFNGTMCGGGAYTGWQPIPRYWEAWRVDAHGNVSPMIGGINDMFTRPLLAGSRGNWVMSATLYTTKTLPASFVANSLQDAGILRATLADPGGDFLGYVANRRRVGGTWNCCPPVSTHVAS